MGLVLALLLGFGGLIMPGTASAAVSVTVTGDGVTTPTTWNQAELEAMTQVTANYSTINTWPTKKMYVARGVSLADLLQQAGIKDEAKLIKVTSTDGYKMTFTLEQLIEDKRYYFPGLRENDEYLGYIPGSPDGAVQVPTILALANAETNDMSYLSSTTTSTAPILMMGQRWVTEQTNNAYAKYVGTIEVTTETPAKWETPAAAPISGNVAPGTQVALSTSDMDGDNIHYTTDGSDPGIDDPMYNWIKKRWWNSRSDDLATINHTIEVNQSMTIKTFATGFGKYDSDEASFDYQVLVAPGPALTADSTDNTVGQAIDITFTDDGDWRAAITGISVNGTALSSSQYTVSSGNINIAAEVFTAAGDYTVVVTASGYSDASVTQTMNLVAVLTPPTLTADSTDNTVGMAMDITFPADADWEAAITGITVNGYALTSGQYTVGAGNINIAAEVFTVAGDYAVVVTASGYSDASVTQTMAAVAGVYATEILTWTDDPTNTQTITWLMSEALMAQVQYLEADEFTGNFDSALQIDATGIAFGSSHYRYSATLSGLTANTQYVYRVGSEGAWGDTLSFTTAADTDDFSFLYMGDVQEGYAEWESMLDSIHEDYPELKFSLMGGDLTDNGNDEAEWIQFLDAATDYFSEIPLMPTLGNHDGNMYRQFFALPANGPEGLKQEFYSFDYGNAHFVVLYSGNNTDESVKQWLQADLQNSTQPWKFAMFHHPAYPAFEDYKTIDESICENWLPILEQNGVDMVFVGHQHEYMRTYPIYQGQIQSDQDSYGIVYVMGNAGSKAYAAGADFPYIAREETGSNYQVIDIDGDTMTMTSNKANGELIESYTIDKSLDTPPALTADSSDNTVGQAIDISFTDDTDWRAAITGITVGGSALSDTQYTVTAGNINIAADVFTAATDYTVVVTATGYDDATVTQTVLAIEEPSAVYSLSPAEDDNYTPGTTVDGINTMTVKAGVSGFKYFTVEITPVTPHAGNETVVFTHLRNGIPQGLNATRADFDQVSTAHAGFNVQAGDVIKVYIVDELTNDEEVNPIILQ